MTNILAFDTSGNACSVALLIGGGTDAEKIVVSHAIEPMQQAKTVLPVIQMLLSSNSLTMNQLHAVAFGAGPGSFTGLRLASSVAQAIGYTADIPIIAISSLAALAQSVYQQHGWERVLVAVDARKNQFYWAPYKLDHAGLMELQGDGERLVSPHEANVKVFSGWYGVGDAWEVYREKLGGLPDMISPIRAPHAEAMLALALHKFNLSDWISSSEALPVYLNPYKS